MIMDLNLVGQCDGKVGLNTKYAMVKVSDNVEKNEPLSQAIVDMTNTKKNT